MDILYLAGCIACLALGGYLSIRQAISFIKREPGNAGFDTPELIAGAVFIIIGIIILAKYL